MTPDPAAVAALRVMACPWSLGIDGEVPVCVPAATENDAGVTTPVEPENATERPNGRTA